MKNRIWILGAPDPEMELIESLLRECGEEIIHATDESGRRVHPGNAYRCPVPEVPDGSTVYAVECIDVLPDGWVRIDHHRPGDPGYGRPSHKFLRASSIGCLTVYLAIFDMLPESWIRPNSPEVDPGVIDYVEGAWRIGGKSAVYTAPQEVVFAAAADHCLAAAYRGECPGVDPDALMVWRVGTRAAFQGRSPEEILADIEQARAALREAPTIDIGGSDVRDLRDRSVPELPEAAMREGMSYLTTTVDRDGRTKIVLGGHTTPSTVKAFLSEWAPAQGLVDTYGDPARGFAGGYLPQHAEEAATA